MKRRLKIAKELQSVKVLVKWGPFNEEKNFQSPIMPKKTERGLNSSSSRPFSLARLCMLRGEKGKTLLVQFPGPTGAI